MKKPWRSFYIIVGLALLTGCAPTRLVIESRPVVDTNGKLLGEMRSTRIWTLPIGDYSRRLERLRMTNGKTQGIGISELNESGSMTNMVRAMELMLMGLKAAYGVP